MGLQAGENVENVPWESLSATWKQFFIPAFHGRGWMCPMFIAEMGALVI